MSERLIAGWGAGIIGQCPVCKGSGERPVMLLRMPPIRSTEPCMCEAGRRLREQAQEQGERKVLAGEER